MWLRVLITHYDCCNNEDIVLKETVKCFSLLSLLTSAHLNLRAVSDHRHSHGKGMHICDLLKLWSIWFSSAASPVLSAAAGDRPAAGRAADREEPSAQTHAEAAGSTAGGQTEGEAQTHRQAKGIVIKLISNFVFFIGCIYDFYAMIVLIVTFKWLNMSIITEGVEKVGR